MMEQFDESRSAIVHKYITKLSIRQSFAIVFWRMFDIKKFIKLVEALEKGKSIEFAYKEARTNGKKS